ncbi:MAG TPA: PepSY-associated TM helix domain-containing protein, partial [Hyphomicrobiales bacterium]|nr:PepSY-associated TM helix domain-containing protein [Hyphomicrobiales bacterium]
MGTTFRQSMAWLHGWAGLVAGWILFFVFLTGTFAYVSDEIDRWMRPELPLASPTRLSTESLVQLAERR